MNSHKRNVSRHLAARSNPPDAAVSNSHLQDANERNKRPLFGLGEMLGLLGLLVAFVFGYLGLAGFFNMWAAVLCLLAAWSTLVCGLVLKMWEQSKRKTVVSAMLAGVALGVLHFWIYKWGVRQTLQKEQDETYRLLSSTATLPPSETHPYRTYFAIVNNGSSTIGSYTLDCGINVAVTSVAHIGIRNFGVSAQMYPGPISGNGDSSESDPCLWPLHPVNPSTHDDDPPRCLDVSLTATYTLKDQPNVQRCKMFRYVTIGDEGGKYFWLRESFNMKRSACFLYMNPEEEKSYEEQASKLKDGGNCAQ